ncbi:hypothetical protein RUM43_009859 [Polyplax serrata]|uniref:Uncharacterized protein n=1 Tax=Polyplax serrata TaxID=468196 RepID=A0AAN8PJT1_POLSC
MDANILNRLNEETAREWNLSQGTPDITEMEALTTFPELRAKVNPNKEKAKKQQIKEVMCPACRRPSLPHLFEEFIIEERTKLIRDSNLCLNCFMVNDPQIIC